ncbi:hypothetical protein ACED16_01355 [Enterobacter hormaechei]
MTIVSFLSGCVACYFFFVRFGFNAMAGLTCPLILTALGGISRSQALLVAPSTFSDCAHGQMNAL